MKHEVVMDDWKENLGFGGIENDWKESECSGGSIITSSIGQKDIEEVKVTHVSCIGDDCVEREMLFIGDIKVFDAKDLYDCPEDATLNRDMTNADDICSIITIVQKLKDEGKRLVFLDTVICESEDEFWNFKPDNQ